MRNVYENYLLYFILKHLLNTIHNVKTDRRKARKLYQSEYIDYMKLGFNRNGFKYPNINQRYVQRNDMQQIFWLNEISKDGYLVKEREEFYLKELQSVKECLLENQVIKNNEKFFFDTVEIFMLREVTGYINDYVLLEDEKILKEKIINLFGINSEILEEWNLRIRSLYSNLYDRLHEIFKNEYGTLWVKLMDDRQTIKDELYCEKTKKLYSLKQQNIVAHIKNRDNHIYSIIFGVPSNGGQYEEPNYVYETLTSELCLVSLPTYYEKILYHLEYCLYQWDKIFFLSHKAKIYTLKYNDKYVSYDYEKNLFINCEKPRFFISETHVASEDRILCAVFGIDSNRASEKEAYKCLNSFLKNKNINQDLFRLEYIDCTASEFKSDGDARLSIYSKVFNYFETYTNEKGIELDSRLAEVDIHFEVFDPINEVENEDDVYDEYYEEEIEDFDKDIDEDIDEDFEHHLEMKIEHKKIENDEFPF